jgi:hypothetical protein
MAEPVAEPPPELVEELYGAPPEEFIARRDARAKELRSGGDRALADAVKKLRRPSVSAAAVNLLARVAASDVEALLAAGEALRQAQLGGGDRDAIRSAAADERSAVERLVTAAGRLSPAVAEEVRGTLHAAASDEETRGLVRRGVLTEARQPLGFGLSPVKGRVNKGGQAAAAPRSGSRRASGSGRSGSATPDPGSAISDPGSTTSDPGSARQKDAERAAAEAAEAERLEAERAAEAERKAAAAERKRAAKQRVKEARAALRDAEKAVRAAERERDRTAKELAKAESAAESA